MKPIVIESKFRPMTNSFLPLGDRTLIKTDYRSVNSLIAMFLWAGSTDLSCFLSKTKKSWPYKKSFKERVKRAVMEKAHHSKIIKVRKTVTASVSKSQRGSSSKTTSSHMSRFWRWEGSPARDMGILSQGLQEDSTKPQNPRTQSTYLVSHLNVAPFILEVRASQ